VSAPAQQVTALCCASCGQLTPTIDPAQQVTRQLSAQTPSGNQAASATVELTRCVACAQAHDAAAVVVAAHPQLAARLGSGRARDVVEGTLMAQAALMLPADPPLVSASSSNGDLALWIRHLGTAGLSLSFAGRLTSPAFSPAPFAWAHLGEDDRQRLRTAYAAALHERVSQRAAPVQLAPPSGQPPMPGVNLAGCAWCGRATVTMPAAQVAQLGGEQRAAQEVWSPLTMSPESVGGRISPNRVSGYCCPDCSDAYESTGAVGQSALHKALGTYLRSAGRTSDAERLSIAPDARLPAWIVSDLPPGETPWQFLDLGD